MRTEQLHWREGPLGSATWPSPELPEATIVFCFGSNSALAKSECFSELRQRYPNAYIAGCSTAGEIRDTEVHEDSIVATAIEFASTEVVGYSLSLSEVASSREAGRLLAERLDKDGLVHVLVLSDGLAVNGSDLALGMSDALPDGVAVTGGLSGDGQDFDLTHILANAGLVSGAVVAIGLYGPDLEVGYGSLGGWETFGPERVVTRAQGNVLFELDGRSALALYKEYLGEHSSGLPATGLLFPLSIRTRAKECGLVRTVLSVNEQDQSMTFAGDVPVGSYARLMSAKLGRLVDGARAAADSAIHGLSGEAELALLISCVGRKMVLKQRTEEEVEAVRSVLGDAATLMGFYSYGEIAPFEQNGEARLHNQTMTITTFAEGVAPKK